MLRPAYNPLQPHPHRWIRAKPEPTDQRGEVNVGHSPKASAGERYSDRPPRRAMVSTLSAEGRRRHPARTGTRLPNVSPVPGTHLIEFDGRVAPTGSRARRLGALPSSLDGRGGGERDRPAATWLGQVTATPAAAIVMSDRHEAAIRAGLHPGSEIVAGGPHAAAGCDSVPGSTVPQDNARACPWSPLR
jgi:hypothetical protein